MILDVFLNATYFKNNSIRKEPRNFHFLLSLTPFSYAVLYQQSALHSRPQFYLHREGKVVNSDALYQFQCRNQSILMQVVLINSTKMMQSGFTTMNHSILQIVLFFEGNLLQFKVPAFSSSMFMGVPGSILSPIYDRLQ